MFLAFATEGLVNVSARAVRFYSSVNYKTVILSSFKTLKQSYCTMTDKGVPLKNVVAKLKEFAPLHLAESWDNVGLLVEPAVSKIVNKILLTNDLTEDVLDEAVDLNVDLIVSYHPPVFVPLKSVTMATWKERIVARCLKESIAVYSPHTSFDCIKGGVNDWLLGMFDTEAVRPITQSSLGTQVESHLVTISVPESDDGRAFIKNLKKNFQCMGYGSKPHIRNIQEMFTGETVVSITCAKTALPTVAQIFFESPFSVETERFKVSRYEDVPSPHYGLGRVCELKNPLTLQKAVQVVKEYIGVPHVKLAVARGKTMESEVQKIAVCAGSGSSVLKGIQPHLFLTGEMSHHDILDAVHKGIHVILCDHSNSERGFLKVFQKKLAQNLLLGKVEVLVSEKDKDPLQTV